MVEQAFLTISKKLMVEKLIVPKTSTIFHAKTQRTSSGSGRMNFNIIQAKPAHVCTKRYKKCYILCIMDKKEFPKKTQHFLTEN